MFEPITVNVDNLSTRFGYPQNSPVENLTKRQYEILRGVALGKSNKGIAEDLCIRENTVSNHLLAIYRILGISEEANQRVMAALVFHRLAGVN